MTFSPARLVLLLLHFPAVVWGLKIAPEAEIQSKLSARLQGKESYNERVARRIGDRTIEVEGFIAMEGDIALAHQILSEPKAFSRWILPGINQRPSGGGYFVKVMALNLAPGSPNTLVTDLRFDLPLFKKDISCYMDVKTEMKGKNLWFTATVHSMKGTYIEHFEAMIQFFPKAGGQMWVYALGQVKFKSWLLYEALPDRLLTRETGERLQIVIDNYLNEENYRRSLKRPSVTTSAPKKKGGPTMGTRP